LAQCFAVDGDTVSMGLQFRPACPNTMFGSEQPLLSYKTMHPKRMTKAFSLIELLVVTSVISLLISMLLPSLSRAKALARRVVCLANLSGIGKMVYLYACDNDEYYPDPYAMGAGGFTYSDGEKIYYGQSYFRCGVGFSYKEGLPEQYGLMGALLNAGLATAPSAWICPGATEEMALFGNTYWNSGNSVLGNKRLGDYTSDELFDLGLLSDNHWFLPANSGVRGAVQRCLLATKRVFPHAEVGIKDWTNINGWGYELTKKSPRNNNILFYDLHACVDYERH